MMNEIIGKRALEAYEDAEIKRKIHSLPEVKNERQTVVFFDGSCWPNPGGEIGVGVVIYEAENFKVDKADSKKIKSSYTSIKVIEKFSHRIEECEDNTNNVAEHTALNTALLYLKKRKVKNECIFIFGDSEITIRQMKGDYAINPGKKYYPKAKENVDLVKEMSHENIFKFIWIPRELNTVADNLSKI